MRVIIQRVKRASVEVSGNIVGEIAYGLLVFCGFEDEDDEKQLDWTMHKIVGLRIFPDEKGNMNISVKQVAGSLLVVSQFTLHASIKKGMRPSFIKAAKQKKAEQLYELFLKKLENAFGEKIERGIFGADMKVSLLNDGPVTIFFDSLERG